MFIFKRNNFFPQKNVIHSNEINKLIKKNIIKKRINFNFQIFEISSLNNFRENSILFIEDKNGLKLKKLKTH